MYVLVLLDYKFNQLLVYFVKLFHFSISFLCELHKVFARNFQEPVKAYEKGIALR